MFFPYAPLPPPLDLGGTKRNLPFLLENLKRHDVSVLSYGTKEEEEIFRKSYGHLCKRIVFVNRKRPLIINALQYARLLLTWQSPLRMVFRPNMQRALDEMLQRDKFDVVHCCTPVLGYFTFPKPLALVSDTHEVTYDLKYRTQKKVRNPFFRALLYAEYLLARREEPVLCRKFDAVVATTRRDYDVFRQDIDDRKLFVVSNGVQSAFLEAGTAQEEPESMVFTGLMSYYPNNHGILWFLKEVFPLILKQLPRSRVFVVGKNPSQDLRRHESERVMVTGYVEDVRPYMARAQVFIIPLLIGGGIRGKALEAMAMRKPIVTTSLGCEGIQLRHNDSALFADTPEEFAASVVKLFQDGALRRKMTDTAYQTVLQEYNWSSKGEDLQRVYEFAVKNGHANAVRVEHLSIISN